MKLSLPLPTLLNGGKGFRGDFYIWRQFDANNNQDSTRQEIEFDIENGSEIIPVHFKNTSGKTIEKNGTAYQNGTENNRNSDEILWEVDFNIGEETITNAVFTDTFTPTGLTIDQSSIEVIELNVKLDGTVSEKQPKTTFTNYSFENISNGFQLTFNEQIDKAYRVKYTTTVEAPSGPGAVYNPTYTNNVTVDGIIPSGAFHQTDKDSVAVTFNEPLNKYSTDYDSSKQEIEWTIEYNYNQQTIAAEDAWLEDTFDTSHQELIAGEFNVFKVEIDNNGNAINATPVDQTEYTLLGVGFGFDDGFRLQFNHQINSAYKIVYKTKAKNRVYEAEEVENTVKMHNGTSKTEYRTIGQEVFKKDNGSIDYENKKISWTIHLNKDGHTMNAVEITDSFARQGLKLVEGTFTVRNVTNNIVLTRDVNYTLVVEQDSGTNADFDAGFTLTFTNTEPVTNYYTITYETTFDPTYFSTSDVKTHTYENEATIEWQGQPTNFESTKKGSVSPNDYMKKNGNKTGSYNAQTKEITWTIDVNFNRHTIDKAVVRDFYTSEQNFVPNSLKVHHLNINTNGTVREGELVPNTDYTFTQPILNTADDDGFELTFNNPINSAYRITYKTDLKGLPVLKDGYSNQATLHDENDPTKTLLFNEKANVNPQHRGEYVNKETPVQGIGAEQVYATWTVNINRSQSYVANPELTDTLSPNQILLQDSFKLYKPTVATTGNLGGVGTATLVDPSEYTITFATDDDTGADSFTLTFNNPIENAYILQYKIP